MKFLVFCVVFPVNAVIFTVCTFLEWAVELFNLPFEVWEDLK